MRIFKKKAKRGFTLVELVVVIAVIAILAAVSVGAYFGITDSANNSKLEQEAKMVHTNLQLVLSANNSNHYMTRDGAYIGDTTIFECKFNEMTGGAVSYDFKYGSEPTSISKDTIYFIPQIVSSAPGSLTRYTHFGYYSNSIANKRAVVDIVSGKVDVEKTTVEVGGEPGGTVPGATEPVCSFNEDDINITLANTNIYEGESENIEISIGGTHVCESEGANYTVTFKDEKFTYADGKITAKPGHYGADLLTVTAGCNSAISKTIEVTSVEKVYIEGFAFNVGETTIDESYTAYIGSPVTINVSVTTQDLTQSGEFDLIVSGDDGVYTSEVNGNSVVINPLNSGAVTITATAKEYAGNEPFSQSVVININPIVPTSVSSTLANDTLLIGQKTTITSSVLPNDATVKTVKYTYDSNIIQIDSAGNITALAAGTCKIVTIAEGDNTVKTENTITVLEEGFGAEVNGTLKSVGDKATIVCTFTNVDASRQKVEFFSSDSEVIQIDRETGEMEVLKNGKAVITVKPEKFNEITFEYDIKTAVTGISLDDRFDSLVKLYVGDSLSLNASVVPTSAFNKTLSYTSSNNEVITVDENGDIIALNAGDASITIKSSNENVSKVINFTVEHVLVSSFEISCNVTEMLLGGTGTVSVTKIEPSNASLKEFIYISSNTNVLKVSDKGEITAVGEGVAHISVYTSDKRIFVDTHDISVFRKVTLSSSVWDSNLSIAAYLFDSNDGKNGGLRNTWVDLNKTDSSIIIPHVKNGSYDKMIFVAFERDDTVRDFSNKIYQTVDITIPETNKTITIESLTYDYYLEAKKWDPSSCRVEAYFFGDSGSKFEVMTLIDQNKGIYGVKKPDGNFNKIIFVRMDPNNTINSWGSKWNQTGNIILSHKYYLFAIKNWDNDTEGWYRQEINFEATIG